MQGFGRSLPSSIFPRRVARALFVLLGAAGVAGCTSGAPKVEGAEGALPPGAFALLGGTPLGEELFPDARRAAPSADTSPRALAEAVVREALFARELGETAPDRARLVERGELSRALIEQLARVARESGGPPQKPELVAALERLWLEVDRPRAVRTGRISIHVEPLADDTDAEAVMLAIAANVKAATNLDDFVRLAQEVPARGLTLDLGVEPPVTADGRVVPTSPADERKERFDLDYAKAAASLDHIGQISDLVRTADGFHVIVAMEIIGGYRAPTDELRARLAQNVNQERARAEFERLEKELRGAAPSVPHPHQRELLRLAFRSR